MNNLINTLTIVHLALAKIPYYSSVTSYIVLLI
jgi:hypothetical protein